MKKPKKLWGGRFQKPVHLLLEKFNASLPFDKMLYAEDIDGSIAHARMLRKIGVLSPYELESMEKGLSEIRIEIENGKFSLMDGMEDIHTAIEAGLAEKIGPSAGKLHTARSRNDQVALDLRLFCKKKLHELILSVTHLQKSIVDAASKKGLVPMPGYTHLQRAQPVYWAHHWMAYFEMLERDKGRLKDTLTRTDVSPLGSGALAGSAFPVDREFTAKELGFASVSKNSLDAVSDRDFAVELVFDLSLIMAHLSRLAEELVLWSSQEFGFVTLPQEFCTGSSMMPQKVNPDVPELVRGKTGRVYGHLTALLTVLKGLPLSYNKDLQEDKEALFDSVDTVASCLEILTSLIPGITPHPEAMKKATEEGFLLATDLADYLVSKGVAFRKAHEVVGRIVSRCVEKKTVLEKLSLDELRRFSEGFESDVSDWLKISASLDKRNSTGGTALSQVKSQIARAKKALGAG